MESRNQQGAMPGGSAAGPDKYAEAYMNNLNSVLIEGNMVRDPLSRSTSKGTMVCNFTIASNRYYKQDTNFEKEVGFFDVETWGKLADVCSSHGRKGRGVRVVGRLKQDRWTGNDGKNHTKVAIVAEHVEYRSDFKKNEESAADDIAETLAEDASEVADPDSFDTQQEFPMEAERVGELQEVAF